MTATLKFNSEFNGIEIYFDEYPGKEIINKLHEMKWYWHKVKKCWYSKQTEENLNFAKSICSNTDNIEIKPVENVDGVKVGDIYYTSWGYDMTIVDFFQVISVTAKRAKLKKISSKVVNGSAGYSGKVIPVKDSFKENAEVITTGTDISYDGKSTILKNCDGHTGYKYENIPLYFDCMD